MKKNKECMCVCAYILSVHLCVCTFCVCVHFVDISHCAYMIFVIFCLYHVCGFWLISEFELELVTSQVGGAVTFTVPHSFSQESQNVIN